MHFTYEESAPKPDLQQGDVIKRTDEVDALLKAVHPHYYESDNYRFFLILTQSCDLVRRGSKPCNGRYITIAAVRPLEKVVERKIQELQYDELERRFGICRRDRQSKLTQFMERLLNNNEEEFFYLYREPTVGLSEDHCAFLLLSIALKARVHYDTLLSARILSLTESFQHKLGYLVGSLYSRIGTQDWTDFKQTDYMRELAEKPAKSEELVIWLEKEVHNIALEFLKNTPGATDHDLQNTIKGAFKSKQTRKEEVLSIIGNVLFELNVTEEIVKKVRSRLQNNPEFSAKVK